MFLKPRPTLLLLLVTGVCFNGGGHSFALKDEFEFRRISVTEGLSHNIIHGIFQDQRGFLWISTDGGVNRYDGHGFTIFQHDPLNPHSVSSNNTSLIMEDAKGYLWIGTWGGGLNRFDPFKQSFRSYVNIPGDETSLADNRIQSLMIDRAGSLWVGTAEGGIHVFRPESDNFKRYSHDPDNPNSPPNNRIWSIVETEPGTLCLGTDEGMSFFHTQSEEFTHLVHNPNDPNSLSSNRIKTILRARSGELWIGTALGLNVMDSNGGQIRRFDEKAYPQLGGNEVRTIFEDSGGMLWIGTRDGGITRFDPKTQSKTSFSSIYRIPENISLKNVKTIYEDRSHVLWLGTFGGIYKTDLKPKKFEHYFHIPDMERSLSNDNVSSIYLDEEGILWVGTFGGGLNRVDRDRQTYDAFAPLNENGTESNVVRAILRDRAGHLWLGNNDALHRFNPEKKAFTSFRYDPDNPDSLGDNRIRVLFEDPDGMLWVGTDKGPNLYNPETRAFRNANNDAFFREHLLENRVHAITRTRDDWYWLGTEAGLIRFDAAKTQSLHFRHRQDAPGSLTTDRVNCLVEDYRNRLWVGTQAGLNLYIPGRDSFEKYFVEDGLPSNVIISILEDEARYLWISTQNGLCKFSPETFSFRNYDIYDGLQDNSFNMGASFKSAKGELFFGGPNGLNSFFPEHVRDNLMKPPILLTSFKILNQDVPLEDPIYATKGIVLAHSENVFSLEFAALDFTLPGKNRYRYKLENFRKDWIDSGTKNQVTYTNLDPGEYIFKVQGTNNDGIWNYEGRELKITIVPPFWRTWWAYSVYGLVLLCAVFGLPLIRIRNLKKREEVLARLVSERTGELEAKNQLLGEKNHEMLTLDEIVRALNREVELSNLLRVLLEQGLKLLPNAEIAGFLIYDHQDECFKFSAVMGVDLETLKEVRFTREEALQRYTHGKRELEEGVYLIKDIHALPKKPELKHLPVPKDMLAMTVTLDGVIEGFLVMENLGGVESFKDTDVTKLKRFRDHAISAVAKARLVKDLSDTAAHLEQTQQLLMDAAHHSGMAEIATNVLHNVGNTLNSINTCSDLIFELGNTPAVALLEKVAKLFQVNLAHIDSFLATDKRAKKIPEAVIEISKSLSNVHEELKDEALLLLNHVDYLRQVVNAQQEFVQSDGWSQVEDILACVEEALNIERQLLESRKVAVVKEFQELPEVMVQRSKFIRVLVNLIENAVEAMADRKSRRKLILRASLLDQDMVRFEVVDNGRGIAAEQLDRIFNQGFTTKKKNSSFGLHYSANAMREMSGSIRAFSDGPTKGATFVLTFPVDARKYGRARQRIPTPPVEDRDRERPVRAAAMASEFSDRDPS